MTLSWSSSGFRSEAQHILAYRHLQVAIRYPTQSFGLPASDSARAPNGELSRSPSLSPSTSHTGFQLLDQDVAVACMTG